LGHDRSDAERRLAAVCTSAAGDAAAVKCDKA
jgi:hypothetical protein